MASIFPSLTRFLRNDEGSLSVEAALMLPVLCTFYVGTFVWFDSFRVQNTNLKAAYTISDMISRESEVDQSYLNDLNRVLDYLTYSNHPTYARVTTMKCVDDCDKEESRELEICWSWATPGRTKHDASSIQQFIPRIPLMPLGDTIVLTESFMAYEPIFDVGITPTSFEMLVVTRPRFSPDIPLASGGSYERCYDAAG